MDILKIISIALIALVFTAILKQHRPEFAMYFSISVGIIILYFVINELTPIINILQTLSQKMGVNSKFLMILLKITGVAYLTEFGTNVCKDSGETAIASKVELAGKVIIIGLSIPIITTLLETLLNIL